MTLGRCSLSIFFSRGTPPNPASITVDTPCVPRAFPTVGAINYPILGYSRNPFEVLCVGAGSHGARPVHLTITMIKWIRTSRLSIKNSLSGSRRALVLDLSGGVFASIARPGDP